jgi:cell division protein ZapD
MADNPTNRANPVILYEFPLNERVRTLLRLEDLYESVAHFSRASGGDRFDHHACLLATFNILDVASRADLKSDLLQELERQRAFLLSLKDNPAIAADKWAEVMGDVEQAFANLHRTSGKTGQELRDNDWLMAIKQRVAIPGGACEFDLPSYHYWMHLPMAERARDLGAWLRPLEPIRVALDVVLRVLRESGRAQSYTAIQGTFQQMPMDRPAQLLRLALDASSECVPELSANKHALNIRFLAPGTVQRSKVVAADVPFELAYCNL